MITVEHVDFVGVATQDVERAKAFYGETLGLPLGARHARRAPSSGRARSRSASGIPRRPG